MNKILLSFLLFSLSALCVTAQDLKSKKQNEELILSMPYVEKDKTLPDLISIISGMENLEPVAFCDDLKCLLVTYDRMHPDVGLKLMSELKKAGYLFDIKQSATIAAVLRESKKIISAETGWQ